MVPTVVLGVDIGGSHITAALVNTTTGAVLPHTKFRAEIDAGGTAGEIIDKWAGAIRQSWAEAGIGSSAIGIAMPGPFDYDSGICLIKEQDKYQALYGHNIKEQLSASLKIPPHQVRFINDACSFLKGELLAGALKGCSNAIGITLGTGLGSAFYQNGQPADADLWKAPFKTGIAEDYLSTRWFVQEYKTRYGREIKNVKELVSSAGRDEAAALFGLFANNLASFVQYMYGAFGCSHVVIGGNIAKASAYFLSEVKACLAESGCPAGIHITRLWETASLIGAASSFQGYAAINMGG